MKIISKAELDEHDIEHLRAIAQIDCALVRCTDCQLRVRMYGNQNECMKDIANLCLRQNDIDPYGKER